LQVLVLKSFFYEPAGASFGRSASPRKNKFQNLEAFHCNLGQKRSFVDLVIRFSKAK
jgi:hypothetical protein